MTRVQSALRNAVVLVLVGGGAAAYYYLQEVRPRDALQEAKEQSRRLFQFGRAHVDSGRLTTKAATVAFTRNESRGFVLSEPVFWPADEEAVAALLDRLATLKVDPVLTEAATEKELERQGLLPPPLRLEVTLADGTKHELSVGPKNPLVNKYPVTLGPGQRLGLAEPSFYWAFDRPPEDFRLKRLLPLAPAEIAALEVTKPSASFRLSREGPEEPWQLTSSELKSAEKASPKRVEIFFAAFHKRLDVTRFITDEFDPSDEEQVRVFSLDKPAFELTARTFDGNIITLNVAQFLEASADEGAWVVHRTGSETVMEVDPSIEREVELAPEHFIDMSIGAFDPREINRVRMQLGAESPFELIRDENGTSGRWKIKGQPSTKVKGWRVDAVVRAMANLSGDRLHRRDPTTAERSEWLLEPASRRMAFFSESGDMVADIRIGNRLDDVYIFAESGSSPRVYVVREQKLVSLPSGFEDFVVRPE